VTTIAFNGASLVGRELGYEGFAGVGIWMEADAATQARFRPLETFRERFSEVVDHVAGLGFRALDLWPAHLNPSWATPQHITSARELLAARGVEVASIGGRPGETREEFDRMCRLAEAIGTHVIAGMSALPLAEPDWVAERLARGDLVFGYENHPERTPEEVLERIPADASGRIGITVDTGWWGTQGYDAARAIEELGDRVVYVHLKDVRAQGAHVTCTLGEGIVPVERCVAALATIGYSRAISIEHVPPGYDPSDELAASATLVEAWLGG
jgi:L-ribulose-5-phosphate 3-epimerase